MYVGGHTILKPCRGPTTVIFNGSSSCWIYKGLYKPVTNNHHTNTHYQIVKSFGFFVSNRHWLSDFVSRVYCNHSIPREQNCLISSSHRDATKCCPNSNYVTIPLRRKRGSSLSCPWATFLLFLVNAWKDTLIWKYFKQRILFPKDLNWETNSVYWHCK
jgi:hypothetical protein